jgi:transposase
MTMEKTNTQTFMIPISTGIYDHIKSLGSAVYLMIYYVDKTTREVTANDGSKAGRVLGGAPLHDADVARALGVSVFTARRWRSRLARAGYIRQKRTGWGYTIELLKSKKWWRHRLQQTPGGVSSSAKSELPEVVSQSDQPCSVRVSSSAKSELPEMVNLKDYTVGLYSDNPTNQPIRESVAGEDHAVLVGRLVSLYQEKTGERFNSNKEQRRGVGGLASAYGAQDVIATFEEWLKRPRGTGGLEWPLAQFIGEYAGYSPAQQAIREAGEREAKARRLAGVRCPACHGSKLLQSGTWRKCVACDRTFDAADLCGRPG